MEAFVGKLVMPGDIILDLNASSVKDKIVFGPGLRREEEKIISIKCGILKSNSSKVYYIDNHQKKYVPLRGESVIGTVVKKGGEEIFVDIGSSEPAIVDLLSFEGATKRNKPNIKIGDLIYGKIVNACKYMETELVCVDSYGKSVGFGVLPEGGFVFPVSLGYCRRLLAPNSPVIKRLGQILPFEMAVGLNGKVWLKSTSNNRTLVLVQAITVLEYASAAEIEMMSEQVATVNTS